MRILMVCLGNICRSPLAEGILKHLAKEKGLNWQVASAGTGDWHIGCPPDDRSVAIAMQYGYDISTQRAQQFNTSFFDRYDHILVMDRANLSNVLAMAKTAQQRAKVRLFLLDDEVIDPYQDSKLFDFVCQQIEARCKNLIAELS